MKTPITGYKQICDGVFMVGSSMRSHPYDCAVYAVAGPNGAVMIDCGCPAGLDKIEQNMRDAGVDPDSVELIFGTHCHYDHVGAAAEFKRRYPKARLAMHGADAAPVESGDVETTCAEWLFGEPLEPTAVDFQLQGGDEVFAGGLKFDVLHTPGHSPGSVTIVLETGGHKVAFTGDSYIPSCPRVGYDFDAISDTWLRLLDIGADFVCPGHDNHSTFDPVVLAMSGVIPASVLRSAIGFRDLAKPVAAASSFYYENLGVMLKPFKGLVKLISK